MKGLIHKVSGYFVDPDGTYSKEKFESKVNNITATINQHLHVESSDIDIEDDDPLMYEGCDLTHCEKYFKTEPTSDTSRVVKEGQKYRHFKEGKIVEVIAVSQDTENIGSFVVVYKCLDENNNEKIWHRPYDMFVSLTDKEKYPDAIQEYRFELVED